MDNQQVWILHEQNLTSHCNDAVTCPACVTLAEGWRYIL